MNAPVVPGPVMVASGCGGTGRELAPFLDLAGVPLVTRTLTRRPRPGGPGPHLLESPGGLLHHPTLANPGLTRFLADELPALVRAGAVVLVSVAASSLGEYAEVTRRLGTVPGVAGLELNLSSPGPLEDVFDAREPFHAASVVATVRRELPADLPLLAKVRSDPGRVVETSRAVLESGASAVVVGNALPAAFPDGRPAGLGGPAVRPVVLRCVHLVRRHLPEARVVASGGISTAEDARTFLAAGAEAVQLGTAVLHDPTVVGTVIADLEERP